MADKGIVVEDAASGESVACVDLRNNDDDANARIAQLVSGVTSPEDIENEEDGTPIRTLDFGTSGGKGGPGQGDGANIDTANKLTPLLYPDSGTKVGTPLPGVMLRPACLLNVSDTDGSYDAGSGTSDSNLNVEPLGTTRACPFLPMVFPTLGAKRVAFHMNANQDNEVIVSLFAYPLTGAQADAALVALHVQENKLSVPWFNDVT